MGDVKEFRGCFVRCDATNQASSTTAKKSTKKKKKKVKQILDEELISANERLEEEKGSRGKGKRKHRRGDDDCDTSSVATMSTCGSGEDPEKAGDVKEFTSCFVRCDAENQASSTTAKKSTKKKKKKKKKVKPTLEGLEKMAPEEQLPTEHTKEENEVDEVGKRSEDDDNLSVTAVEPIDENKPDEVAAVEPSEEQLPTELMKEEKPAGEFGTVPIEKKKPDEVASMERSEDANVELDSDADDVSDSDDSYDDEFHLNLETLRTVYGGAVEDLHLMDDLVVNRSKAQTSPEQVAQYLPPGHLKELGTNHHIIARYLRSVSDKTEERRKIHKALQEAPLIPACAVKLVNLDPKLPWLGKDNDSVLSCCRHLVDGYKDSVILQAADVVKRLIEDMERYRFHPFTEEGRNVLRFAIQMWSRSSCHKMEMSLDPVNSRNVILLARVEYLMRVTEKYQAAKIQVELRKKFDNYISSRKFMKDAMENSFSAEKLAELPEFQELCPDLNTKLKKFSLKERCKTLQWFCNHDLYMSWYNKIFQDPKKKLDFERRAKDLRKEGFRKDIHNRDLEDGKFSSELEEIKGLYFPDLPKAYAVQAVMDYLYAFACFDDDEDRKERIGMLWCLRCEYLSGLWKNTRYYDDECDKITRQPTREGVFGFVHDPLDLSAFRREDMLREIEMAEARIIANRQSCTSYLWSALGGMHFMQ